LAHDFIGSMKYPLPSSTFYPDNIQMDFQTTKNTIHLDAMQTIIFLNINSHKYLKIYMKEK